MTATFDSAAQALARLDFAKENAAIAERETEAERLQAGILKAEARIAENVQRLSMIAQERNAVQVADALLSDADATEAAAQADSEKALREEQAALRAGIKELQGRALAVGEEIAEIRNRAAERLAAPMAPVIAELVAKAQDGAEAIMRSYASLAAITASTKQGYSEANNVGIGLSRIASAGVPLFQVDQILPVPDDIAEMLAALGDKGNACPAVTPRYVPTPQDHATSALIAAMAARQAVG